MTEILAVLFIVLNGERRGGNQRIVNEIEITIVKRKSAAKVSVLIRENVNCPVKEASWKRTKLEWDHIRITPSLKCCYASRFIFKDFVFFFSVLALSFCAG